MRQLQEKRPEAMSRAELELHWQMHERTKQQQDGELTKLHAEVSSLRERLSRMMDLEEERTTQAGKEREELYELRLLKRKVDTDLDADVRSRPSDEAWRTFREAQKKAEDQLERERSLMHQRQEQLEAQMRSVEVRLAEAAEREEHAAERAAAACKAMEAAEEATATAEQAAKDAALMRAREALGYGICAVARDRQLYRRGIRPWWEGIAPPSRRVDAANSGGGGGKCWDSPRSNRNRPSRHKSSHNK